MPRQRPTFSDTDSQCTEETPHHSGKNDSDSDSDPPSRRNIGLTKSYSSSEESSDSHLHTNRRGSSEAAAEEGFTSGVGRTEVGYKLPIVSTYLVLTSASLHANEIRSSIAIQRA